MQIKVKLAQEKERFNKQLKEIQDLHEAKKSRLILDHNSTLIGEFLDINENSLHDYECGFITFREYLKNLKDSINNVEKGLL